jgi:hypothetical protein
MSSVEGNVSLTRDILRAELRATRAEDRLSLSKELDERFKPITDHLNAIDGGAFSDGMRSGILAVVAADHAVSMQQTQQQTQTKWSLLSSKAALATLVIFALVSIFNVSFAIAAYAHGG